MKSRLYKGFLSFVFIFLALIFFSVSSYAATGFEGFAIYRNGAFLGTTWHAGLMDEAHPKKSLPVIHVGQSNDAVVFDSWENFINKKKQATTMHLKVFITRNQESRPLQKETPLKPWQEILEQKTSCIQLQSKSTMLTPVTPRLSQTN